MVGPDDPVGQCLPRRASLGLPLHCLLAEERGFSGECSGQGLPLLSLFYTVGKKGQKNRITV